jgi:GNAT superfamily N-acetyltransferase
MSAQEPLIRPAIAADTDWIVALHAELYAKDEGFDDTFGPLVASILEAFFSGHDPELERGWIAETDRRLGTIFCVRLDDATAKLRLFLLEPEARGLGLGRRLLSTCTGFARAAGYNRMTLWTHESHRAACRLYAADGFACVDSHPVHSFGRDLVEQIWTRDL